MKEKQVNTKFKTKKASHQILTMSYYDIRDLQIQGQEWLRVPDVIISSFFSGNIVKKHFNIW